MPSLPTYEAPNAKRGLQPSDIGVSAYEQKARQVGNAFDDVGRSIGGAINNYEQHKAIQETSEMQADYAKAFAGLTQNWNQTASAPDAMKDPDTAEKWRQEVLEPALNNLGANATSEHGQETAKRLQGDLRMHFLEKTMGDQSKISSEAVTSNLLQASNALSQAAYADPSSLDAGLNIMGGLVDAQIAAHKLDPDTAARIRGDLMGRIGKDVAISAVRGLAENNPDAAVAELDAGKFDKYFNGEEAAQLKNYAKTQEKVSDTLLQKKNEQAAKNDLTIIEARTVSPNGELMIPNTFFGDVAAWMMKYKDKPGAGEMVTNEGRAMIDYGRSVLRELSEGKPSVTDAATYSDFSSRLTLSQNDPRSLTDEQVIRARADGRLSDKDYSFFKGAINTLTTDPGYKAARGEFRTFLTGIKSSITKSNILMGSNDPAGDQRYLQFEQAATAQFEQAYKSGGTGWRDVLDRNNKNSLWHVAVPYMTDQKGAQDDLRNQIQGSVGLVPSINAPQRGKGESAADYLKRTGGP